MTQRKQVIVHHWQHWTKTYRCNLVPPRHCDITCRLMVPVAFFSRTPAWTLVIPSMDTSLILRILSPVWLTHTNKVVLLYFRKHFIDLELINSLETHPHFNQHCYINNPNPYLTFTFSLLLSFWYVVFLILGYYQATFHNLQVGWLYIYIYTVFISDFCIFLL